MARNTALGSSKTRTGTLQRDLTSRGGGTATGLHLPQPRRQHGRRRTRRHPPAARRLHLLKGLAPGSRRDRGGFWLTTRSVPPAAVLLTESAVDALSAVLLPAPGLPTDCLVASTAGTARRLPRWLQPFQTLPLLCGYDADPAGDQAARALLRLHTPDAPEFGCT